MATFSLNSVQKQVASPTDPRISSSTQSERSRPDEGHFVLLTIQQARRQFAPVVERGRENQGFLIAGGGLLRLIGNGPGHAPRQRAIAGVREENLVACDRKFLLAQFFVGEDFGERHRLDATGVNCGVQIWRLV